MRKLVQRIHHLLPFSHPDLTVSVVMNCISFALLLWLFTSCNSHTERAQELRDWKEPNGKIKVLSTTAMIHSLVQEVGREHVNSLTLIRGELDPHSYQLVKGDDEKFLFADLLFYNGLGLEHGPSLQKHLQNNPKAIGLGNQIQLESPELILIYNGQTDPHIWMDISLWKRAIPIIVRGLSEKDPAHAESYQQNGNRFLSEMEQTDAKVRQELAQIPPENRYLVSSHDAFNYFARAYLATEAEHQTGDWQSRVAAPEGLSPESQLSTADIQYILSHLKKYNIQVLFPESNLSKDSIRKIIHAGREQGLNLRMAEVVLYGDAMGSPGSDGDTYLKMIFHNARVIKEQLNSTTYSENREIETQRRI